MGYILSREEMRDADSRTSQEMHVPSAVLMERAALLIAGRVIKKLDEKGLDPFSQKVLVVCGPGNNGGDGFATGRILLENGVETRCLSLCGEEKMSPLEREQYLSVKALDENACITSVSDIEEFDVVVDAVFGISLNRMVEGEYADIIKEINGSGSYIISVDIPSGVDADSGQILGNAVKADETVSLGYLKPGNVLYPGASFNGELIKGNIGITSVSLKKRPALSYLELNDTNYYEYFPYRFKDSNKGTFGKVLLVAGSRDVAGAAVLAARAALRTGCGMVRVLTHENNRNVIMTACPEVLVTTYSDETPSSEKTGQTSLFDRQEKSLEEKVKEAVAWCTVIAAGPGIGTDAGAELLLKTVLKNADSKPVVLDADALNIIGEKTELITECLSEIVVTPHLKEMSVLTGIPVPEIKSHIIEVASDYAAGYHVTCVLKDSRTVTAMSDGYSVLNLNGNSGMATAGSGDVLTGIIASLIAQGSSAAPAAYTGVGIHATAGDRAAKEKGQYGMTASDIIEYI
ncbi:MAG: NAD(P)H-hydrate dehydratase [Lachnospiraceae bacterium]|nr:NAD(P)H-hydrate dehydratase [Lachnospiraceae bacterium]